MKQGKDAEGSLGRNTAKQGKNAEGKPEEKPDRNAAKQGKDAEEKPDCYAGGENMEKEPCGA